MPQLMRKWQGFTPKERAQYQLEVWAAVTISSFLFIIALTFAGSPSMVVFTRIGGKPTAVMLALLCALAALLAPALIPMRLRLTVWQKQRAYALLSAPLLFYAMAVFFFARDTGSVGAGTVLYGVFFNLLSILGVAVYRDA